MEKLALLYLRNRAAILSAGVLGTLALVGVAWWQVLNAPPPPQEFPLWVMPENNAHDYYVRAGSQIAHTGHGAVTDERRNEPTAPLSARAALLADNARALDTLHQGFQHPCSVSPIRSVRD